ncbi:hypothetical protein SDDV_ORF091 [Scale drop disease virus]|nr:hypothetical protein SDDV_ORF091 [Scale drop disease virus]
MSVSQINTFVWHLGRTIDCTPVFFRHVLDSCVTQGLLSLDCAHMIQTSGTQNLNILTSTIVCKDYHKFLVILRNEDRSWFLNHWYALLRKENLTIDESFDMYDGLKPEELHVTLHYKHVLQIFVTHGLLTSSEQSVLEALTPDYIRLCRYVRVKGPNASKLANKLLRSYYETHHLTLEEDDDDWCE